MSVLNENQLLGAPPSGQYQIQRSLRFNSSDSAYLSRVFTTPTNNTIWTFSTWIKRSQLGAAAQTILSAGTSAIDFQGDLIYFYAAGPSVAQQSTAVFRDPSAWYHLVVVSNGTTVVGYINNSQVMSYTGTLPQFNSASTHTIGKYANSSVDYFNGYLTEIHFIDGQALTPSSFGQTDANGEWQPKAYTGTYGTNGFKLNFADNSAATAAALGKDTSGNGNNWTPNNFSVIDGQRYSQNYVANTPSGNTYYGDGWTRGFNADLNDGVFVYNNEDTTLTLPSGMTWNSKIRIRLYWYGGVMIVNGTTLTGSFTSTPTWYDFTSQLGSSGTLNTIKITSVSSNYMAFCAVELDNVVLYDNSSGNDSLVDTPTSYGTDTGVGGEVRGNYCTLNPLQNGSVHSLSDGNLRIAGTAAGTYASTFGTIGMSSGKWYWEQTLSAFTGSDIQLGLGNKDTNLGSFPGATSRSYGFSSNDRKWNSNTQSAYTTSWVAGAIIGLAFDADAGSLTLYRNGVSLGVAFSGIPADTYFPIAAAYTTSSSNYLNFGQRPFAYTAPSGFKALCDTNLPAPTIVKPSTVMDVSLYTGNGTSQTISGLGFSPDFVWIKGRSAATSNRLFDQVRGAGNVLFSDSTATEATDNTQLSAFTSTGFSVGSNAAVNTNAATYAGWCWDAGSSTVTNTAGTITSTVRANPSAGFSIVTYTGTSSNATVGHGLGATPHFIIVKNRGPNANNWAVYHSSIGTGSFLLLNSTNAAQSSSTYWNNSSPTASLFSVGISSAVNESTSSHVAYCFAPVAGYSSFGSYTGNSSADGPFVFCNFRPRWVMVKNASVGGVGSDWYIFDAARQTYNVIGNTLAADLSDAEFSSTNVDFLASGFKLRSSSATINGSSNTIVYAAFAENPFQYARAR